MFGQVVSTLLVQGIRVASAATARFEGHASDNEDHEPPHEPEEPAHAGHAPCTAPAQHQNGAHADPPHVALSVAGGDSLGSETTSGASRLADVAQDVVLRIECYDGKRWSYGTLAVTWFAKIAASIAAISITVELLYQTRTATPQNWFKNRDFAKVNCATAAALLAAVMSMLGVWALRAIALMRKQKQWTQRRWRLAGIHVLLLLVQVPNAALYVGVNVWTLTGICRLHGPLIDWFSFISWSTLGSTFALLMVLAHCAWPSPIKSSRFAITLERPWSVHWPILLCWVPFEVVAAVESFAFPSSHRFPAEYLRSGGECYVADKCPISRAWFGLYMTLGSLLFVFAIVWLVLVTRAVAKLRRVPYHHFKLANMMIRFQIRIVTSAMLTFVISSLILQLAQPLSCVSYLLIAFGRLPNQVVVVAMVCMMTFFHMPKLDQPIITAWIQDFAWAEKDISRRCAERAEHADLPAREPMFCMETALKLLYWSFLVYREESEHPAPAEPVADDLKAEDHDTQAVHGEEGEPGVEATLGRGLAMYDLKEAQIHSETATDTHCLLAWSADTILLAFRGTATKANVLADLQAWPVPHPPKRGSSWLGTRPRVHLGFLRSWRTNGLNERVLEHIRELVDGQQMDIGLVNVYITGHSLGGALGILAAYDIQQAFGFRNLRVYTYGAPRVGNHRFAREYNDTVPNTWTVINDKDIVPTVPKWKCTWLFVRFSLFKRSGLRVHLSEEELIAIRPSLMEARLGIVFNFGGSVKQHLLASYIAAFVRVCNAQRDKYTRMRGGGHGVRALLHKPPLRSMLLQAGLDQNLALHTHHVHEISKANGSTMNLNGAAKE